jgi:hypothetical protein
MTPPFLKDNPIALIGVGIVAIGMLPATGGQIPVDAAD